MHWRILQKIFYGNCNGIYCQTRLCVFSALIHGEKLLYFTRQFFCLNIEFLGFHTPLFYACRMKNYKSISLHLNTVCIEPFNINVFTSMMHNTVRIIMTLNLEDFAYGHGKLRITSFGIFTNKHGYAEKLLMQKR